MLAIPDTLRRNWVWSPKHTPYFQLKNLLSQQKDWNFATCTMERKLAGVCDLTGFVTVFLDQKHQKWLNFEKGPKLQNLRLHPLQVQRSWSRRCPCSSHSHGEGRHGRAGSEKRASSALRNKFISSISELQFLKVWRFFLHRDVSFYASMKCKGTTLVNADTMEISREKKKILNPLWWNSRPLCFLERGVFIMSARNRVVYLLPRPMCTGTFGSAFPDTECSTKRTE